MGNFTSNKYTSNFVSLSAVFKQFTDSRISDEDLIKKIAKSGKDQFRSITHAEVLHWHSAKKYRVCIKFKLTGVLQILLLIISEFKQINKLLFPLKSSENLWFFMISGGIEVNQFAHY